MALGTERLLRPSVDGCRLGAATQEVGVKSVVLFCGGDSVLNVH